VNLSFEFLTIVQHSGQQRAQAEAIFAQMLALQIAPNFSRITCTTHLGTIEVLTVQWVPLARCTVTVRSTDYPLRPNCPADFVEMLHAYADAALTP
jgi:hypothetical protein